MAIVDSFPRHSTLDLSSSGSDPLPHRRKGITSFLPVSAIAACALIATLTAGSQALAQERANGPALRQEGWLVKSYSEIANPISAANTRNEAAELKAIVAKRTAEDIERFRWWTTGGPAYRWNEIILDEMQTSFVTLPLAARHLALCQASQDRRDVPALDRPRR